MQTSSAHHLELSRRQEQQVPMEKEEQMRQPERVVAAMTLRKSDRPNSSEDIAAVELAVAAVVVAFAQTTVTFGLEIAAAAAAVVVVVASSAFEIVVAIVVAWSLN